MLNPVELIQQLDPMLEPLLLRALPPDHERAALSTKEKFLLLLLSSLLTNRSIIVEVGTYMGGSASILAKPNPTNRVFCFDVFDDEKAHKSHSEWTDKYLGPGVIRSRYNVRQLLRAFENITLTQVKDRDTPVSSTVSVWRMPVDLYFEDGNHKDPVFTNNVNYWVSHLKVNGYMVLHDYRPDYEIGKGRHPDVDRVVEEFKNNDKWQFHGVVDSTALFQKLSN
jgi:hypothetical protein